MLSRLQFALTAMFHILWPVLTIGLSCFLVITEALWLKTGDDDYFHHARFWSRLLVLNFAVGVVSGLPLEFEFGTNWAPFAAASGDFFGNILGFEGAMAFMLEAGFIGIMALGWQRVPRGVHFFATCMVALGASLSAFWILVANSWMQMPLGGHMEGGHFVVDDFRHAVFNAGSLLGVTHMWVACLETGLFVIGGISAWYLLRARHTEFFLKSFRLAVLAATVVTPLQIWLGDSSGRWVFENQPAKGAALEGHWQTNRPGEGAAWAVLAWPDKAAQSNDWALNVPDLLSLLATHSFHGRVAGLKTVPPTEQPPALPLVFYAFRLMVAIGFWFLFLTAWTLWNWAAGRLTVQRATTHRRLLRAWVFSVPLGYLAVECGWLVRELGRQPWIVYGLLKTRDAASALPAAAVATSLSLFALVYTVLLVMFLALAWRFLRRGPDLGTGPAFAGVPVPAGARGEALS
jgi:cytochrome d ubiquinol oxidase subunit I